MWGALGLEHVASKISFEDECDRLSVRDMLRAASSRSFRPARRGLIMVRGAWRTFDRFAQPARVLRALFLNRGAERTRTRQLAERVELRPLNMERDLEHFSGGNQQKVMIAKALSREVKLFIFDEPTVGVDVGTRVAIYGFIRDLCEAGAGVLLISSDLPEILHLTNRTYVMYRGELRAELKGAEITQEGVLRHFFEKEAA
jgi:ribose transport system ATP-binding protein